MVAIAAGLVASVATPPAAGKPRCSVVTRGARGGCDGIGALAASHENDAGCFICVCAELHAGGSQGWSAESNS